MWGRRTGRTGDAAEAARRRLATIAAEFDRRPSPAAGSPSASSSALRTPPGLEPSGHEGSHPRHRAPTPGRGRRGLTVQHLAVVVLAAAALLALAAWWALRAVPHAETVPVATTVEPGDPAPSPSAPASEGVTDTGTPPPSTPHGGVPVSTPGGSMLVVDVAGKVRRPGIVELSPGSRVVDALAAAGGARPGVDTSGLNLARPLVDGEQIVVGLRVPPVPAVPALPGAPTGVPPAGSSSLSTPAIVDINTADQAQLETLPGIGPVTAQAILEWRAENGAFTTVDQLLDVSGIGDATLADIQPFVRV